MLCPSVSDGMQEDHKTPRMGLETMARFLAPSGVIFMDFSACVLPQPMDESACAGMIGGYRSICSIIPPPRQRSPS